MIGNYFIYIFIMFKVIVPFISLLYIQLTNIILLSTNKKKEKLK